MKRREFLKISIISGIVVAIGGGVSAINMRYSIQKVLNSIHADLVIPEKVLNAFLEDASRTNLWKRLKIGSKERMILLLYSLIPTADFLPYNEYYQKLSERIIKAFIPATSFFQQGMDTIQPLQYNGLYNPFSRACGNPFSSIFYPQGITE